VGTHFYPSSRAGPRRRTDCGNASFIGQTRRGRTAPSSSAYTLPTWQRFESLVAIFEAAPVTSAVPPGLRYSLRTSPFLSFFLSFFPSFFLSFIYNSPSTLQALETTLRTTTPVLARSPRPLFLPLTRGGRRVWSVHDVLRA
jgi:hypothetical protein